MNSQSVHVDERISHQIDRPIPVLEVFGPTVQGEGMVIGRKTMFVRTAGCDYHCSWCDSSFTWDGSGKEQIRLLQSEQIWDELYQIGGACFSHVTLSGGNPALLPQLGGLVQLLHDRNIIVAVETQGSKWQDWLASVDEVTISPKPPSSGMNTDWEILDEIINHLEVRPVTYSHSLKVVIFNEEDLDYAVKVHLRYLDTPMYLQVGNADVHTTDSNQLTSTLLERYEWLIEKVMESSMLNQVRVLPQLHTLIWGNKRGV
ncbi:7-carboxy-7-deazaguanine synthase QueE [Paenibacillus crassostreae]|uniref:7-carboxy-7-deazaguanine synthase n=1 Tax=Paenibacillus crassostreae TaxID=1763538 RepID=A0A167GR55_9BACL|nr:7-carboxy-7-deazaguanine synthase QueE [Paenibacillus crassostreae]AOZ92020.1 7-carboxy-7-deazaguanine synthase QueE [Paenibacillus crassostreae]OAB77829.1 7-carboxy-7-deazaguanine synthase [Paenibacillus crassostreae]